MIGGVLRDPQTLPDLQAILRPESFHFDAHQKIFRAVCDLANEGKPVDLITVHDRLTREKWSEDVGGAQYLAELWDSVPTGASVAYHAGIVREAATLRGLAHVGNEIVRDALDRTGSAEDLIGRAERQLFDLGTMGEDAELLGAADLSREALESIDDRARNDGPDGLETGFGALDEALSGLKPGQLIVVGARPSCGKTALGLAITNANAERGEPSVFVSLEMPRREIMDRLFAMRSGVPLRAIQRGNLTPEQAKAVTRAGDNFGRKPFHLLAPSDLSAARLAASVRRGIRRHGLRLVVVDYLQLMRPENERDPRHLQVGTLARRLKQLARSCNIPVVLLAQLNREVENRAGGKPRLADLRESGEIEAHADVVLLLHPQPDQHPDEQLWTTEIIIAKNRNGPIATVTLGYRRPLTRFENYTASAA